MAMMTCLEDSITFRYSVVIEKKDLFLKIEEDRKLIMENFTLHDMSDWRLSRIEVDTTMHEYVVTFSRYTVLG